MLAPPLFPPGRANHDLLAGPPRGPSTSCPDDNQIVAFTAGKVRGTDAAVIEGHMDQCPDCRLVLAELAHSWSIERTWVDSTCDWEDEVESTTGIYLGGQYAAGQMLADRFCLLHRLGTGGMGQVYEAEDTLLGVPVAIKLLPPRVGAWPELLAYLHQEILLGRRVSHPNVCRIHDLGKSGDVQFLTMELLEGDTLAERLACGPIPYEAGLRIIEQMVAALAAAHREGVVHGDLKPGNIMIGPSGHVKVMDFSLARDHRWQASSRPGPVGTPGYWAPEQAAGAVATAASDVYSLGLVMRQILSGDRSREPLKSGRKRVPRALRQTIARCLAARPQDRFASAVELEARLRRLGSSCRRRAPIMTMVPAVGIATTVLALCIAWGRPRPDPQISGAPAPAVSAQAVSARAVSAPACLDQGSVVSNRPTGPAVRPGADEVVGVLRRNRPAERGCAKP